MLDWQTTIALGIVMLAAAYILRAFVQWLRGGTDTGGGCHGCPSGGSCNSVEPAGGLVQIQIHNRKK